MEKNKVSIIVPVYNVEKYLERCINSLINQTLKDIEILLIDDGSTDSSGKLCDLYADKDSRIKVIHKNNQGLGFARNTGLYNATGKYIVFVDSDDFISLNTLEDMYNRIELDNSQVLINDYFNYNTRLSIETKANSITNNKIFMKDDIEKLVSLMIGDNPLENNDEYSMSVWGNIYLKDAIIDNGVLFCSERDYISEDAIFHLNLLPLLDKISISNKAYYYYCNNDDVTLTSQFRKDKFYQFKILYNKEIELVNDFLDNKFAKICMADQFLGNIRAYMKLLVKSDLKFKEKRLLTKKIISDELVRHVLSWYPYNKSSIKQRLFSICLKYRFTSIIIILARLQANK